MLDRRRELVQRLTLIRFPAPAMVRGRREPADLVVGLEDLANVVRVVVEAHSFEIVETSGLFLGDWRQPRHERCYALARGDEVLDAQQAITRHDLVELDVVGVGVVEAGPSDRVDRVVLSEDRLSISDCLVAGRGIEHPG